MVADGVSIIMHSGTIIDTGTHALPDPSYAREVRNYLKCLEESSEVRYGCTEYSYLTQRSSGLSTTKTPPCVALTFDVTRQSHAAVTQYASGEYLLFLLIRHTIRLFPTSCKAIAKQ
jgi:hypothetical protein